MSVKSIILNQSNITTQNNVMQLHFPQQMTLSENMEISLLNCYINYSWFNITTAYDNRTVSYYWPPDNSTNLVTFGQVFFLVSDISNYLQAIMLANGHYLVDDNGENVFYFEIQTNYTVYGTTATFTPLPSSLPVGWSNPAGVALSVPNARTPQLVIGSNNFGNLIGFAKNTSYPATPQTIVTQINSPIIPQISPTSACLIACNMVNSPNWNQFGNIIASFSPTAAFGSQINLEPPQSIWYKCMGGNYPLLQITFYDNHLNALGINDTNIVLTLMIRETTK